MQWPDWNGRVALPRHRHRPPRSWTQHAPRWRAWTDVAQADLIAGALARMGVDRAVVLGHSWGCSVAIALALNHPDAVSALVLASGYYYPSPRIDAAVSAALLTPLLGVILRHAVSPPLARAQWPLVLRKLFGPAPTSTKFEAFPKEMTFRPSQIRASAADAALMVPDAAARARRYRELTLPIVLIAGEVDRVVDIDKQSGRLHAELSQSTLRRVPGAAC